MKESILFINASPNKNGNTVKMAQQLLMNQNYTQLDLVDYKLYPLGQHFDDDQFDEVYQTMEQANTLVMGTPVYWYSVASSMQIVLDRFYEKEDTSQFLGKDLYFIIQGEAPSKETLALCNYTMGRFCKLYHMDYMGMTST